MTDLTEFLLARIAEDETWAREAIGHHVQISTSWDGRVTQEHIYRWSSKRVLAECDAKRRLIEIDGRQAKDKGILAALALPYADHPDYDQAWRP